MKSHFNDPWLDALAGSDAKPDRRETDAVRSYFAKRTEDDGARPFDAASEARMMAYLRSRNAFGIKEAHQDTSVGTRLMEVLNRLMRPPVMSAALASVALMVVGVFLLQRPTDMHMPANSEIYRGNQAIVKIATTDPAKSAATMAAILKRRQVPHRIVNMPDNQFRIEAKVTTDRAETEAALSAWKIPIPENGVLVIELGQYSESDE